MRRAHFVRAFPSAAKKPNAFTLVEVMVVVAIIGILMIVALPAYNNYSTKSKFAEVVVATAPTKTAISTCASTGDCVSGSAISLSTGGGTPTGLFVPSLATASDRPTELAAMTALERAYNSYYHLSYTDAQLVATAQNNVNAGFYVILVPGDSTKLCVIVGGSCYADPVGDTPVSAFNQFYAPNAAIIAAASSQQSLPCVGASSTGCSPSTKYAQSVSYDSTGIITATAQTTSGLKGETFVLIPALSGNRVDWSSSGSCKTRAGGALC